MAGYPGWNDQQARQVISGHAQQEGGLLPALHALQSTFGCVPQPAIALLAEAFNLSRADVHGTLTFYHDFRRQPPGRHVLRLCRGESCQALGGNQLAETLRARLDVDWGGTTADTRVTLEPTFCLGLCAVSPAALLDGVAMGRMTAAGLVAALDTLP